MSDSNTKKLRQSKFLFKNDDVSVTLALLVGVVTGLVMWGPEGRGAAGNGKARLGQKRRTVADDNTEEEAGFAYAVRPDIVRVNLASMVMRSIIIPEKGENERTHNAQNPLAATPFSVITAQHVILDPQVASN
ncbi:hypothetical protein K438DRAFT_1764237 [Mycena galopus ATCC 62051]|nr:hypothetical protein K438DRAFT_1764237 [Mycena galopus ATCC 62051]